MAIPPMNLGAPDLAYRLGWVTKKQAKQAFERANGVAGADALEILAEIAGLSPEVVENIARRIPAPGVRLPADLADEAAWIRASEAFDADTAGAKELGEFRRASSGRDVGIWTSRLRSKVIEGASMESFGATRVLHLGAAPHSIEAWTLSSDAGGGAVMWIRFNTNADGVFFELAKRQTPSATYEWFKGAEDSTIRYLVLRIENLQWSKSLDGDEAKARAEWDAFVKALRGVFDPLGITLTTTERDASVPAKS